jgi:hypothetical protein
VTASGEKGGRRIKLVDLKVAVGRYKETFNT